MLQSLNAGISGMQQFQQSLDVIGNNIANVETTGYKAARTEFADAFSQTIRGSSPGSTTNSDIPAMQIGSGVTTSAIRNLYTPGAIARTGVQTDLAVSGNGFFIVRDTLSDLEFATRSGEFRLDDKGYLVTNDGKRVQGFADSSLTTRGDIQVDDTGKPASASANATVTSFSIDSEGRINVRLSDGNEFTRGQILLQTFSDPQALVKQGNNQYSGLVNAGPLGGSTPQTESPGTNGLGLIQAGALELSNVDLAQEFTNLIKTQRAFQASARIITTSDEFMQELVNLKR